MIKPYDCPICGSKPEVFKADGEWFVWCSNGKCWFQADEWHFTKTDAIKDWNGKFDSMNLFDMSLYLQKFGYNNESNG